MEALLWLRSVGAALIRRCRSVTGVIQNRLCVFGGSGGDVPLRSLSSSLKYFKYLVGIRFHNAE